MVDMGFFFVVGGSFPMLFFPACEVLFMRVMVEFDVVGVSGWALTDLFGLGWGWGRPGVINGMCWRGRTACILYV